MKRTIGLLAALVVAGLFAPTASATATSPSTRSVSAQAHTRTTEERARFDCEDGDPLCAETVNAIGYHGKYTGHDEPALLFYSDTPGSGNNSEYHMVLPAEPPTLPVEKGRGGTFNFQNRVAFWLGMDLCEDQSAPEYTNEPCTPNSDTNIFDGGDPAQADYIGKHPGTGFLELQFYPPGWVPFQSAISCDATKWCAAMALFGLNLNMNTGASNNASCLSQVGIEPVNFAFVTKSGVPHAPAGALDLTLDSFTPNPSTDLFMGPGDKLRISIHDSAAGLVTRIDDLTTGQTGSMTASEANGFTHIMYEPTSGTCHEEPYAWHPMYSTSSEHTRVPWAAHTYNVSYSEEIGHFEYCADVNENGTCAGDPHDPGGPDSDDFPCFPAEDSFLVQIGGCTGSDTDFDGPSYQNDWPGTGTRKQDTLLHPRTILFTSPTFNNGTNYNRMAFEADLPRIEASDFGGLCNRNTGANCVNPPPGAAFYPIFTTRSSDAWGCVWQEGGAHIPGTVDRFGGNSTAEFGPLLFSVYPSTGFQPITITNNFRQVMATNPCPST
jgi:hypothetical protein